MTGGKSPRAGHSLAAALLAADAGRGVERHGDQQHRAGDQAGAGILHPDPESSYGRTFTARETLRIITAPSD